LRGILAQIFLEGGSNIFTASDSQQYRAGIGSMTQIIDPVKEQQATNRPVDTSACGGFDPRAMLDRGATLASRKILDICDTCVIPIAGATIADMPPYSQVVRMKL